MEKTRLKINKVIVAKQQLLRNAFPWEKVKIKEEIKNLRKELKKCKK